MGSPGGGPSRLGQEHVGPLPKEVEAARVLELVVHVGVAQRAAALLDEVLGECQVDQRERLRAQLPRGCSKVRLACVQVEYAGGGMVV